MNAIELCSSIAMTMPPLFECSPAPREGIRVRTPLLYPDGGMIDVFVLERDDEYFVTDFGEALGWLKMQSFSAQRNPREQLMVKDVCQTLGIELFRGQLTLRCRMHETLAEHVLRVAQAVVRVSDLWFSLSNGSPQATVAKKTEQVAELSPVQRKKLSPTTADEVDQWLHARNIRFEREVTHTGKSGQNWKVDFQTYTTERIALVFLLTAGNRRTTRRVAEHALAGCVDLIGLRDSRPSLALVSLFDDRKKIWRTEDFTLLNPYAEVVKWSQRDELERILTTR